MHPKLAQKCSIAHNEIKNVKAMADTKTRTILLADLVGSTTQVTRLEAERGADFLHDATQPIQDAIIEHDGKVIKFTGDGFLGTFESADDALEAAEHIRNHFVRQRYTPTGIALDGVRVVVHTSDIVIEDNDIVGDGVIVVARLEKNAPPNSIYVTATTREVCSDRAFTFDDVGEIHIRGRSRPVRVFQLQGSEASYVDEGVTLLITDLHHYVKTGESLSPHELNDWLQQWGNMHRESVAGQGRVRQFIADMSLLTFPTPDDAFHAYLNLRAMVNIHNERRQNALPPYFFKAALSYGDLILSPTGVVGPLVNRTFKVLNQTPRNGFGLSTDAYTHLDTYQHYAIPLPDSDPAIYVSQMTEAKLD